MHKDEEFQSDNIENQQQEIHGDTLEENHEKNYYHFL